MNILLKKNFTQRSTSVEFFFDTFQIRHFCLKALVTNLIYLHVNEKKWEIMTVVQINVYLFNVQFNFNQNEVIFCIMRTPVFRYIFLKGK